MSLVGLPLLITASVFALALPILFAVLWRSRSGRLRAGFVGVLARLGTILLCQLVALFAAGIAVNRSFEFYDSWDDLMGRPEPAQGPVSDDTELVPADGSQGTVKIITVHGRVSGVTEPVLVWFPPHYNDHGYPRDKIPVLMALPGQPGTPAGIFRKLDLAANATKAIDSGQVKPFIAVLPPIAIEPPRDTECTDIPHGPQADSWLNTDVREDLIHRYRVTPDHWSVMGWSTGGFCAAKMLLKHPTSFSAAVSIGGYFGAEEDHETGTLFNHSTVLKDQNSPLWLLQHTLATPVHLLIITSKQDRESWKGVFYADARKAVAAAAGIPGVSSIVLPIGGHNFDTYAATVGQSLSWLGTNAHL